MNAKTHQPIQQVVAIVHEYAAPGAVVEKPGMLVHQITGEEREVDVVIPSKIAGYEVLVGVEATATGRKVSSPLVEKILAKHENLPTSKVILVSEVGFYDPARRLAEAQGAIPLTPKELEIDDPALAVLRALPSLWPKEVQVTPEHCTVLMTTPEGETLRVREMPADTFALFAADGTEVGSVAAYERDDAGDRCRAERPTQSPRELMVR